MERRTFIRSSAAGAALAGLGWPGRLAANSGIPASAKPLKIKKSLKFGMVEEEGTILEKFRLLKELGFDGVELDSPNNLDPDEILEAKKESGLELPGVVNSAHWSSPLSDPDPKVREKCVKALEQSLRDCKLYGGTTVLLVPGVVNQGVSYADAYKRSQEEIRKVLPLAKETGIKIAFENVWNNFLISPLEAARYVDEFDSPMVGWYFDVGNIVRYGWPEHWIEALGKRIIKLDIKEYSRKKQQEEGIWKGFNVELLEGDCNWPEVNKALEKIGYSGWASAEVPGGKRERLLTISQKMDAIFKNG
ncbi:hexulose-6-phosphate isomerase [Anseongella ginsenosidimutans]|uniref:Hexulose-6-phosphate isomerase n=1 Tax=Anseongella ginsenosidimutans TaxID=496056 RepID=A0A4R3KWT4_9SPHI|nr:sugar phosphate isomerase/epimerase family protein [Anseongella ginsenosidimutans]QEC51074.1 TIM barrel protein [Anseongella ginsenosidimutans]TCS90267.1 hexulose-6-phosphate isomerase [Anseongella ginsenosidimutans]